MKKDHYPFHERLVRKPYTYRAGGFDLGGDFAMEFPQQQSIKCYALVSGQCWLSVEGVPEAVRLTAGDCFLLPRGLSSCLASDLTLTAVDAHTIFLFRLNGRIASCNGGGVACLSVGTSSLPVSLPISLSGSCRHCVYLERIGQGSDTLVSGADEGWSTSHAGECCQHGTERSDHD